MRREAYVVVHAADGFDVWVHGGDDRAVTLEIGGHVATVSAQDLLEAVEFVLGDALLVREEDR